MSPVHLVVSVSWPVFSASLAIRIAERSSIVKNIRHPHLSAHMLCGKTADWIRMPFRVVSDVGLGMGVLDFGGDRPRGRGSFGGEFAASHYNQWGLC